MQSKQQAFINLENEFGAKNYAPLPVVLTRGKGVYVWDVDGKRYLDMMSAYSAVSHGHCHPRLIQVLIEQAERLNVVSRAYYTDTLGRFLQKACQMTGMAKALAMNTGVEAVETALKAARKWAYEVKGVAADKAEIIACQGNFHGRTLAVVGMSSEPQYRQGFGPFAPGFHLVEYGDITALESAITDNTAAFILEPIQGEGGIILPTEGYLKKAAEICQQHNVLLIVDEIQTGLGRTGAMLACQHENVKPDGLILGKALGGGILPVSLFLAREEVMDVFRPGDHGSTFGGNPLAASVALAALNIIEEDNLVEHSKQLGEYFKQQLQKIVHPAIRAIRGKGLFIGMELDPKIITARRFCLQLLAHGILSKETHDTVVRLAPPLVIDKARLDEAVSLIEQLIVGLPYE